MNVETVLQLLEDAGIGLGVVDGKLKLFDPTDSLTDYLLSKVKDNKQELISICQSNNHVKLDFEASLVSDEELLVLDEADDNGLEEDDKGLDDEVEDNGLAEDVLGFEVIGLFVIGFFFSAIITFFD